MGAAAIATRDERRFRGFDFTQCIENFLAAGDLRGIALRTNQNEIVVHHRIATHSLPFCYEFVFGRPVVNKYDIGVAAPPDIECLSGAHGNNANLDTGVALERRQ